MNKTTRIITITFLASITLASYAADGFVPQRRLTDRHIRSLRCQLAVAQVSAVTTCGISFYAHYKLLETKHPVYGGLLILSSAGFVLSYRNCINLERQLYHLQQNNHYE